MKHITTTLLLITTTLLLAGCGPHWNMSAKPYEQPKQIEPAVQATPAPAAQPAAPAVPPETVTITIPNWPVYGYAIEGALVILVVRDPTTFPVPGQFVFTDKNQTQTTLPMIKPQEMEKKP